MTCNYPQVSTHTAGLYQTGKLLTFFRGSALIKKKLPHIPSVSPGIMKSVSYFARFIMLCCLYIVCIYNMQMVPWRKTRNILPFHWLREILFCSELCVHFVFLWQVTTAYIQDSGDVRLNCCTWVLLFHPHQISYIPATTCVTIPDNPSSRTEVN